MRPIHAFAFCALFAVTAVPMSADAARPRAHQADRVERTTPAAIHADLEARLDRIDRLTEKLARASRHAHTRREKARVRRLARDIRLETRDIRAEQDRLIRAVRHTTRTRVEKEQARLRTRELRKQERERVRNVRTRRFEKLVNALEHESFDQSRIGLLDDALASGVRMNAHQARRVLATFDFESSKVEAATRMCGAITEPALHVLTADLEFESSRRALRRKMRNRCG